MFTIDIDTGGTFTDGFITRDGELKTVKVLSTPHDLTVCFADCIREASKQLNLPVTELLSNTAVVRYSSTIGVNTLITRTGAKIKRRLSRCLIWFPETWLSRCRGVLTITGT
jgi:N-methylhydantoinase A/acetophenone carboxylase